MNPLGNSAAGRKPPSSQNQIQLHWPGQTSVTAINESYIINEPSLPLNNAGGRRAPLGIEETHMPPLVANQESHIINEQVQPPHHATAGRRTPQSCPQRLGIEVPRQTRLVVNQESRIVNGPFLPPHRAGDVRGATPSWPQCLGIEEHRQTPFITNQEYHIINQPSLPPHRAADGRRTSPSRSQRLGIDEPHQTPRLADQGCYIINQSFQPPHHHAADGRITQPSPSSQIRLGIQEPGQLPSRVNNESLTIRQPSRPLYSAGQRTGLLALKDQLLLLSKEDKLLQHQQHALRFNQESHTIKKPSPPLSSTGQSPSSQALKDQQLQQYLTDQILLFQKYAPRVNQESHTMKKPSSPYEDRRGGAVDRRCASCNNTYATQWRCDPTGQESLCNACRIRLNREEETRALGLQSSNIVLPPGMSSSSPLTSFWQEARSSVELKENNANAFVSENNLLGHSSGLQSSNVAMPTSFLQEERNRVTLMENTDNPLVLENSFLGHSSGLQSSNIVMSQPPEMSPTAAPSLANRVQLMENILLGDPPEAPLPDPSEVVSSLTDETLDNSSRATNSSASGNKVDRSRKRRRS